MPSLPRSCRPLPEPVLHALDLFSGLPGLRARPMFGGWGFYSDDLFFALIAQNTLYLKADNDEQACFQAEGCQPFRYTYPDGRCIQMGYWTAPETALESPLAMAPWARRALHCALRQSTRKQKRGAIKPADRKGPAPKKS